MAANGISVPTQIALSGTGVTQVAGPVYQVTLSLSGTATVAVTATVKDAAGTTLSPGGSVTWTSYNAAPTGQPGKVATVSAGTITAVAKGQAIVEAAYPFGDLDGANDVNVGKVYALIQVQVNP